MNATIVMTSAQYAELKRRLFPPGDTDEQFAFGILGVSRHTGGYNLLLRRFLVADASCLIKQSGASVRPDPRFVEYIWTLAEKSGSSLIDFHTHPFCSTHVQFSSIDDRDAQDSFPKMVKRLGPGPHASIVFGRNSLDAQWYDARTRLIRPIAAVRVVGENLQTILPTSANPRGSIRVTEL